MVLGIRYIHVPPIRTTTSRISINGDEIKKNIVEHVARCLNCQQVKAEHLKPDGLTQMIEVPTWKWEAINLDFVVGFPKTKRQHASIWVIVDSLTTSAHIIPMKSTYRANKYVKLYIDEILR